MSDKYNFPTIATNNNGVNTFKTGSALPSISDMPGKENKNAKQHEDIGK